MRPVINAAAVSLTSPFLPGIVRSMRAVLCIITLLGVVFLQFFSTSKTSAAEVAPTVSILHIPAYTMREKDHWMAHKTIKDQVLLLGGTARSNVLKGSRPQSIRMELSLPRERSAYLLSELSGLGVLSSTANEYDRSQSLRNSDLFRVSIDFFDP